MPNMTLASKDQHRSVKTVVASRLNAAFKPRRQTAFANGKLIVPSGLESECSTLVDYGDDYLIPDDEDEIDDDTDDGSLSAENSAWARGPRTQPAQPRTFGSHHRQQPAKTQVNHAQMLDADDMSWNIPRGQKSSIPTRILHAFAGQ